MEFKIGADPEFFLRDKTTGKFVSAHGLIPGTKRQPLKVDKGAVQVDGMALEFNIDPVTTAEDWNTNITTVLSQLRGMVDDQLEFVFQPVAQFGKEYIDSQPDAAKELGCEPDYNAWTGKINPKPNADLGFRTASGHIHIGWTDQQDITDGEHIDACHMLVKQLDLYLGIPAFGWDQDEIRSSMYGAPGAYRPKHYGVEYRVLSNAWLNSVEARTYVFNQTKHAAEILMQGSRVYENFSDFPRWLKEEASMSHLYSNFRYSLVHRNKSDLQWIQRQFTALANKSYERPVIAERNKKLMNEMYVIDRNTRQLISWEEASVGEAGKYMHPDQYVSYCLDYKLGKPLSVEDAVNKYVVSLNSAKSKKSKFTFDFAEVTNTAAVPAGWLSSSN